MTNVDDFRMTIAELIDEFAKSNNKFDNRQSTIFNTLQSFNPQSSLSGGRV